MKFDIASLHAPKRNVIAAVRPIMEELAERTQQSCHLMVNSGAHMVCVAHQESPAAIGFAVQVGFRPSMVQSPSGRVYFAFQDAARQQLLLSRRRSRNRDSAALRRLRTSAARIARQGHGANRSA